VKIKWLPSSVLIAPRLFVRQGSASPTRANVGAGAAAITCTRFFLIFIGLILFGQAAVAQLPSQKNALRSLSSPNVEVEVQDADFQRSVSESQVRTDVELKLRRAGIRLTDRSDSYPKIVVNVRAAKNETLGRGIAIYPFIINVELVSFINAEMDAKKPPRRLFAAIWETDKVGMFGSARLQEIRGLVNDCVDEFINDYLAANPKP
jgi:hypothetical protein